MSPFPFPRVNGNLRLLYERIYEAETARKKIHSMYDTLDALRSTDLRRKCVLGQSIDRGFLSALIESPGLDKDIDFSEEQGVRKIPSLNESLSFERHSSALI
jgi:hypothetical protein